MLQKKNMICKFGAKCRFIGTCRFLHLQQGQSSSIKQQFNQGGYQNKNPMYQTRPKRQQGVLKNTIYKPKHQIKYVPKGEQMFQGIGQQQSKGNNVQQYQVYKEKYQQGFGQNQNPKDKNSNDLSYTLCRNYHFNQQCPYQNCKKKHQFIFNQVDKIKRVNFTRAVPNSYESKLTKFKSGNKNYFGLRLGNTVTFLEYNIETQQLHQVFNWNLPQLSYSKYNYYNHKDEFIYYSYTNQQTTLAEIGVFHINTQKLLNISNSNNGIVTGIAKFSQNIILSTSTAGQLKVWINNGENYTTHTQSNMKLQNYFNPKKQKISLLFLDITQFNGIKIMAIGTNDCRLLFFIGTDLNFHQVSFSKQAYSTVQQIRYAKKQEVPYAFALVWNQKRTVSTLLEINLTNFKFAPLIESQNPNDYPRNNICMFQFVEDMLIVGNLGGMLSIYKFPECQKIGAIMHQNTVTDIVCSQQAIVTTGVILKFMLVLQKRTQRKEGSLGFYITK